MLLFTTWYNIFFLLISATCLMKRTACLAESTRLLPIGNKRKARDCLNTFSETLVFSFRSIGNKQEEIFVRHGSEEGTPVAKPNHQQMVQSVGKPKLDSGKGMGNHYHYSHWSNLGIGMSTRTHAVNWCAGRPQIKELHKNFFIWPVFQATSPFALKSQVLITY